MSLIPEKPLTFSPTLAATIGLEEAVLLQILQECAAHSQGEQRSGFNWVGIHGQRLLALAPFWREQDIRRLATGLHEKGLLLFSGAPFSERTEFRFAFNDAAARQQPSAPAMQPSGAKTIGNSWQPSDDALRQLSQLGVTREFAQQQVAQFVAYWRERNVPRHSWESKYIKEVWRQWQRSESQQQQRRSETPVANDWRPSPDAMDILTRQAGINGNFVEDAIPEFVLYWRDRGDVSATWDSKFIQHVRRQWHYYRGVMEQESIPRRISHDWIPKETVYDVLAMANISRKFAEQLVPEFVLYWSENGTPQGSWSTKFLQFVKRQWARHSQPQTQPQAMDSTHGRHSGHQPTTRLRNRSFVDDLTDRSWAS